MLAAENMDDNCGLDGTGDKLLGDTLARLENRFAAELVEVRKLDGLLACAENAELLNDTTDTSDDRLMNALLGLADKLDGDDDRLFTGVIDDKLLGEAVSADDRLDDAELLLNGLLELGRRLTELGIEDELGLLGLPDASDDTPLGNWLRLLAKLLTDDTNDRLLVGAMLLTLA